MRTFQPVLPMIAAIALGTSAMAQEAADTAPTDASPAPAAAPAAADAPAQKELPFTVEAIGDWELRCAKPTEERKENLPCSLFQQLKNAEGRPLAEVTAFRLPAGGKAVAGMSVMVPLETHMSIPLVVQVDGNQAKQYPYSFCNRVGCFARVGLTAADVDLMKKGAKAKVFITPFVAPDNAIPLEMSLTGFTKGIASASERK